HPSVAQAGTAVSEFLPLDDTRSTAILASSDERALFDRARTLYTTAPIQTFGPPLNPRQPQLWTMYVPKQLQDQTVGFLAQSGPGGEQPVAAIGASSARSWTAPMRVLRSGVYRIDGGGGTVAIDGEQVVQPPQMTAELFLARGAHQLFVGRSEGDPA